MALVAANCPNCGAGIEIPDDGVKFTCPYCAQKIIIERDEPAPPPVPPPPVVIGPDIANLVDLAEMAETSSNHEEAHKYWSQVLERDPKNVMAWIGKGIAAGWQSTLAAPRIAETVTCLRKALALKIPSKELLQKAAVGGHGVAVGFYNLALQHHQQFQQSTTQYSSGVLDLIGNAAQDAAHNKQMAIEFANRAIASLELSCTVWQELDKTPQMALDIATMCQNLIATKALTPQALATYQGLQATVTAWGKQHDSQWDQKTKKSACFVATATMGDINHPTVLLLRAFRDECLTRSCTGRRFINAYYSHGPRLADCIRHNVFLRRVSYVLLVAPMACAARLALRKSPSRQQVK
jgi:DNA-directed RNA polymerase subunit RPC12/RpoP